MKIYFRDGALDEIERPIKRNDTSIIRYTVRRDEQIIHLCSTEGATRCGSAWHEQSHPGLLVILFEPIRDDSLAEMTKVISRFESSNYSFPRLFILAYRTTQRITLKVKGYYQASPTDTLQEGEVIRFDGALLSARNNAVLAGR